MFCVVEKVFFADHAIVKKCQKKSKVFHNIFDIEIFDAKNISFLFEFFRLPSERPTLMHAEMMLLSSDCMQREPDIFSARQMVDRGNTFGDASLVPGSTPTTRRFA